MAKAAGTQVIGKAFILHGTVKAVAPDGTVRVLGPNSVIYADERIITESDGSVSIMLDGPPPGQIDIGRMSDVLLNEDVYAGATPEVVTDSSADAEKIQEAILQGDQPIELDATAAGGGAGAGGGITLVNFALDGSEGNVTSGADTTGINLGTVNTLQGIVVEDTVLAVAPEPIPEPPPPPPPNDVPTAGQTDALTDDEGQPGGIIGGLGDVAGEPIVVTGTLPHDFGDDGPGSITFAEMGGTTGLVGTETVSYSWDAAAGTLTATGPRGVLFNIVVDQGTGVYTLTMLDNVLHESLDGLPGDDTENDASVALTYTVTDGNGDSVNGTINMTIDDDIPTATESVDAFFVSEYAGYNNVVGTYEIGEDGNPINMKILIASTNSAAGGNMGENDHQIESLAAGTKLFIIANGAGHGLTDGQEITSADLPPGYPVYYMDVDLNTDGKEHFKDGYGNFINEVPENGGEIRIEDLSLGDADYNDVVLRVEAGPTVSEANLSDGTTPHSDALTVEGNLFTDDGYGLVSMGADDYDTGTASVPTVTYNGYNSDGVYGSHTLILDGDSSHSITVNGFIPGAGGSAAGQLTISGDGAWSYTLVDNTLAHPDNDPGGKDLTDGDSDRGTGDQVQDVFNLVVTDADGDAIASKLVININDDGPVSAGAENVVIANVIPQVTNLILTLDVSGSMAGAKLAASVDAMQALIDQYEANGGVHVQLTTFATNAGHSSDWLDAGEAKAALNTLSADGWTNYEAAIFRTIQGDGNDAGSATDPRPVADQTVAYFVTDGEPNQEYRGDYDGSSHDVINVSGTAVDSGYVTAWQTFIGGTVDNLYVVGVETNVTDPDLVNLSVAGKTTIINVTVDNLVDQIAATAGSETISATASLGIDIGADGWGAAKISDVPTMDDGSASVRYVTGVAANGDTLIVTSGGVKLIYEDDSNGGLYAVKEGTTGIDNAIFTVGLNTATSSYTVTMLGTVDAHVVTTGETTDWVESMDPLPADVKVGTVNAWVHKSGSTNFDDDNTGSGSNVITATANDGAIKVDLKVEGYDSNSAEKVYWDDDISVEDSDMNTGDKLHVTATVSESSSNITNLVLTKVTGDLNYYESGYGNKATVDGTTVADSGDDPFTAVNNADQSKTFDIYANQGDFTVDGTGDGEGSGGSGGLTVHYTYEAKETVDKYQHTTEVETNTTTTTETAYDITLAFKVEATDGDGDSVDTVFHVTVDANNDGVLEAVGADEVTGVATETTVTETQETVQLYYHDGSSHINLGDATITVTTGDAVEGEPTAVVISGEDRVDALNDAIDDDSGLSDGAALTENDVMQGGSGDEVLVAGEGDDNLSGGAGSDNFSGGAGEDTINAKDGETDAKIDGGAGADSITYDASHDLAALVPDPLDTTHT